MAEYANSDSTSYKYSVQSELEETRITSEKLIMKNGLKPDKMLPLFCFPDSCLRKELMEYVIPEATLPGILGTGSRRVRTFVSCANCLLQVIFGSCRMHAINRYPGSVFVVKCLCLVRILTDQINALLAFSLVVAGLDAASYGLVLGALIDDHLWLLANFLRLGTKDKGHVVYCICQMLDGTCFDHVHVALLGSVLAHHAAPNAVGVAIGQHIQAQNISETFSLPDLLEIFSNEIPAPWSERLVAK